MIPPATDTIFARASGAGKAGIAVYRVSGAQSHFIASKLVSKRINIREPKLTTLVDPKSGEIIDRGLAILFKAPASYSGEDIAEFHLHGSPAVEKALYDALSNLGARPAEAGEFTLRALKNGKLDLAQAEALADLIDAETSLQRKQAWGQLEGRLSALAAGWRTRILAAMAPLEADIDFPDEGDVPAAVAACAGPAIADLKDELTLFLNQSVRARRIREGVSVAVIGPPNAGKSSLVNALAGTDVAIVSETPGTTRDIIETRLDLGGIVATVADTAGLSHTAGDAIEAEGVRRARARALAADLRIAVLDPDVAYVSRETVELLRPGDLLIWSKSDLGTAIPSQIETKSVAAFRLSSKTGAGMEAFLERLKEVVAGKDLEDGPALTRARHQEAVKAAISALERSETRLADAPELAAEDVRLAARKLGEITGAVGVEDVLGEIFASFCIGK